MKKQIRSLMLFFAALCLFFGCGTSASAAGAEGFQQFVRVRDASRFDDVAPDAWYYDAVCLVDEYGIMTGTSAERFNPDGTLTAAEAVTVVSRLLHTYSGDSRDLIASDPWYQTYVDYALEAGLMTPSQFADYNAPITRGALARVVAALPAGMLQPVNQIEDGAIPDVAAGSAYAGAVYTLYRAGITRGTDDQGSYLPDRQIKRSELAKIVTNLIDPSLRTSFTLKNQPVTLYSDSGETRSAAKSEVPAYLSLGWRTEAFSVPAGATAEQILNAATLSPMLTNNEELDALVGEIFSRILTDDMSTYEKVKACYDYLINSASYGGSDQAIRVSFDYASMQDAIVVALAGSILKSNVGVCDDYTSAFVVMTRRIGLRSYYCTGVTQSQRGGLGGHAWAVIEIGGADYSFDPEIEDVNAKGGPISYRKFCRTVEEISGSYFDFDFARDKAAFNNFRLAR